MPESPLATELLESVLDNAPVAVYVTALETMELLYANRLAERLLLKAPYTPGTPGLTCYQAAGRDAPCPYCRVGEMERSALLVRDFRTPDGRVYQLSGKLLDWAGRPAHIEYITDVTEKRREEDRAQALREELQKTFSSIPCGLCVYRYDGHGIKPLFHNPAFYEVMGYSPEHAAATARETTYLGVHPQDEALLREKIDDAIVRGGRMQHTYRLWNDRAGEYRWISLQGAAKPQPDGTKLLYGVYSDVSERMGLQKKLTEANAKLQDLINAIPGGVALYKVSDRFASVYFSDGVPALCGYTGSEYRERLDSGGLLVYPPDAAMTEEHLRRALRDHAAADFELRLLHRGGHPVWVHMQARQIGEEDGCPLLQCVFHDLSVLKETQLELDHLVNSIPGGIASYKVVDERFIPTFYSDGVMALSGHTREEFDEIVRDDALNTIYEPDRQRVLEAAKTALITGDVLDVSYRTRHKDGSLLWIHLNGRRMGPLSDAMRFYAVFTGMSAETRLFQSIANESADGIYVIAQDTYELLYANESKRLFSEGESLPGRRCYEALHHLAAPCAGCRLGAGGQEGEEYALNLGGGRHYSARYRRTNWNGIPAFIQSVRDVTEEVETRREKERLEQYFQTVLKHLPGGVAVMRFERDGAMRPEFLSDGFAKMTGMTPDEAWQLYRDDATVGVHPDDRERARKQVEDYLASGKDRDELVYRLIKGDGSYVWVKNTLSLIQNEGGESRFYAVYSDVTREREEQERLRQQYNDLILQHFHKPDPNALAVCHCNISQGEMLEVVDHTGVGLVERFGKNRECFLRGLASFMSEEGERQAFLAACLNAPALEAFARGEPERRISCFLRLPGEHLGRYAQIRLYMAAAPGSGDVTGILAVNDVTERTVADRILHQLTVASYDYVIDLNLPKDAYTVLTCKKDVHGAPPPHGSYSGRVAHMARHALAPKDRGTYEKSLDPDEMIRRLRDEGPYTFPYSLTDEKGDIRVKNMTVSAVDLRLGRVCLVCGDITDSVRAQQGLLNMIAYTFELACFLDVSSDRLTMHTRQTVLENLPPYLVEHYGQAVYGFAGQYAVGGRADEFCRQLAPETMLRRLQESPAGYDFVFPYRQDGGERYKQVNVLWGDASHKTICLVRADVTEMLAAERRAQKELERALALAEEASRAKSDFLSAMSHDIRTPMNAIMGMTALAVAYLDDRERVADCLRKISVSSKHLLSLINDILDMSKIERAKLTLNREELSIPGLLEQISAIIAPQAGAAGLTFTAHAGTLSHPCFYGDALRVNQILLNLLGNAVKFTNEGGMVTLLAEELPAGGAGRVRYRFTVADTGVGMSQTFLQQIFDPFTRSSDASRIEGTGLGLSITKGLVDLMGGQISVESEKEVGTAFTVELEFEAAQGTCAKARQAADRSAAVRLAGRRILVAEDNDLNAEILCGLLELMGVETVVTADGAQVVKAFSDAAEGAYDAILMDVRMPVMNGYEATRAIRALKRPDAAEIPIIAMTANAFYEDVLAALEAGMTAHVSKPVDPQVLQAALCKALDQREGILPQEPEQV